MNTSSDSPQGVKATERPLIDASQALIDRAGEIVARECQTGAAAPAQFKAVDILTIAKGRSADKSNIRALVKALEELTSKAKAVLDAIDAADEANPDNPVQMTPRMAKAEHALREALKISAALSTSGAQ